MIGKIFVSYSAKGQIPRVYFEKIEQVSIGNNNELIITINKNSISFATLDPLDKYLEKILIKLIEEIGNQEFIKEKDIRESETIKSIKNGNWNKWVNLK